MKHSPTTGLYRLSQIIGNPKVNPPLPPLIPVSKSTWWAGIKDGRFPAGFLLGKRCRVWLVKDILDLIERTSQGRPFRKPGRNRPPILSK